MTSNMVMSMASKAVSKNAMGALFKWPSKAAAIENNPLNESEAATYAELQNLNQVNIAGRKFQEVLQKRCVKWMSTELDMVASNKKLASACDEYSRTIHIGNADLSNSCLKIVSKLELLEDATAHHHKKLNTALMEPLKVMLSSHPHLEVSRAVYRYGSKRDEVAAQTSEVERRLAKLNSDLKHKEENTLKLTEAQQKLSKLVEEMHKMGDTSKALIIKANQEQQDSILKFLSLYGDAKEEYSKRSAEIFAQLSQDIHLFGSKRGIANLLAPAVALSHHPVQTKADKKQTKNNPLLPPPSHLQLPVPLSSQPPILSPHLSSTSSSSPPAFPSQSSPTDAFSVPSYPYPLNLTPQSASSPTPAFPYSKSKGSSSIKNTLKSISGLMSLPTSQSESSLKSTSESNSGNPSTYHTAESLPRNESTGAEFMDMYNSPTENTPRAFSGDTPQHSTGFSSSDLESVGNTTSSSRDILQDNSGGFPRDPFLNHQDSSNNLGYYADGNIDVPDDDRNNDKVGCSNVEYHVYVYGKGGDANGVVEGVQTGVQNDVNNFFHHITAHDNLQCDNAHQHSEDSSKSIEENDKAVAEDLGLDRSEATGQFSGVGYHDRDHSDHTSDDDIDNQSKLSKSKVNGVAAQWKHLSVRSTTAQLISKSNRGSRKDGNSNAVDKLSQNAQVNNAVHGSQMPQFEQLQREEQVSTSIPSITSVGMRREDSYLVAHDFIAQSSGEIDLKVGQSVIVFDELESTGWWRGCVVENKLVGWFPGSFVKKA